MRKGFYWKLAAGNIRKNRKIYYPYLLTAALTATMLYVIASLAYNESFGSETLLMTLRLGMLVTAIFAVVFLFYTNSFLMKRRKKEFGLLNILGMEKKHIALVVFCETLLLLLTSLVLGLGFGILFEKLISMLLLRLLGRAVAGLSFQIGPKVVLFTVIFISGIFLLLLLHSIRQIHLSQPIELLRGGEAGEKEPRSKGLLAALGAVLLCVGYWISIAVTDTVASIVLFFAAVVCVILGTYLLFTAGSVAALKFLRNRKRFYYQPQHFINVSGMLYRMKRNAVGLANVAVLSTMVLVMLFATFSLWFGIDDTLYAHSPAQLMVESFEPEKREELLEIVRSAVREAGCEPREEISYVSVSFAAFQKDGAYHFDMEEASRLADSGATILRVMTAEDFAQIVGETAKLGENEIWTVEKDASAAGKTLKLENRVFTVCRSFSSDDVSVYADSVYAYPVRWIVVGDEETLNWFVERQEEAYRTAASSLQVNLFLNVGPEDGEILQACRRNMQEALRAAGISWNRLEDRVSLKQDLCALYGGLLFVGLFLGVLFIMAMILIIYYKQISEGYEDRERFRIMRQVGMSRAEIRRCIRAQILTVFFLPLATALVHTCFSFPSLTHMFQALSMQNIPLMLRCMGASFLAFALLYGAVYLLTAREYEKIVA